MSLHVRGGCVGERWSRILSDYPGSVSPPFSLWSLYSAIKIWLSPIPLNVWISLIILIIILTIEKESKLYQTERINHPPSSNINEPEDDDDSHNFDDENLITSGVAGGAGDLLNSLT
jgi:hypothetical protein